MHYAAVWQHSSNSNITIVHNSIEQFLRNSSDFSSDEVLSCLWIVFTNCLSGVPSENSPAGWDLGVGMARGYQFDPKWVCPMGSYAWGIQVFCSRNEAPPHFKPPPWTEHLNTSGITSHGTDSFRVKPITPGHPIPKISTRLFSEGVPERQSWWKQSTDKIGHHQKRNQMDSTRNAQ